MGEFVRRRWALLVVGVVLVALVAAGVGCRDRDEQIGAQGVYGKSYDSLIVRRRLQSFGVNQMVVPTAQATATPGLLINNKAAGSVSLEIQDAGTPVVQILNDGSQSLGDMAITGELQVAQATAATTATPAVLIDSSAAGSALLEVRKATTPVVLVQNDGDVDVLAGDVQVAAGAMRVVAPTAVATATPAFVVDSTGVSNLFEVRDAATPVVNVEAGGNTNIDGGCLNVGGGTPASCGDNDAYVTGDFEVDATLDLDGDIDMDGSAVDVDLSAGFSLDGDTASNVSLSAQDLTIEAETGSIIIKADEAAADALLLDLDDDAATGLDIDVGATNGVSIDGGMLDVGTGSCSVADGDNDVCIADVLEVDGELELDGALDADSTANFAGAATFQEAVLQTLVNGAGASANPWDYTGTLGIMDGSDSFEAIDINITGAAHTGASNVVTGIDVDLTTPDAQVPEKAIDVSDADFDYAIDAGASVIFSSAQVWMEDFFGDTVADEVVVLSGTDPQAVGALAQDQYGVYQLTSGDDGANVATDGEEVTLGLHWSADQVGLVFEARVHFDTAITNGVFCTGLSDSIALEMPATIAGTTITTVASDALVFCFDDAADTDQWYVIGVAGDTDATGNALAGVAPVADTYQVLRIEADAGGSDARFYIDGSLVGSLTANAVTAATLLSPVAVVDTNAAGSVVVDLDYLFVGAQRQ